MGGAAGDLYITTKVGEHPYFRRDGDDIEIEAPITVWEASLGAKIEVPTIDGRTLLKLTLEPYNRRQLGVISWSHPAYANKRLYMRNDEEIVCFSLAEPHQ